MINMPLFKCLLAALSVLSCVGAVAPSTTPEVAFDAAKMNPEMSGGRALGTAPHRRRRTAPSSTTRTRALRSIRKGSRKSAANRGFAGRCAGRSTRSSICELQGGLLSVLTLAAAYSAVAVATLAQPTAAVAQPAAALALAAAALAAAALALAAASRVPRPDVCCR